MTDATPKRIQRKRVKGWRMPDDTVCVCRPGKYGNKFVVDDCGGWWQVSDVTDDDVQWGAFTTERAATIWAIERFSEEMWKFRDLAHDLAGRNLACWCALCPTHAAGKPFTVECAACPPCHADVIGKIANG